MKRSRLRIGWTAMRRPHARAALAQVALPRVALRIAALTMAALAWFGCGKDSGNNPGDPSSGIDWVRTIGGTRDDHAYGLDVSNGAVYVATTQEQSAFDADVVVYRLDATGASVWQRRWGGNFDEEALAVKEANGVIYVAGSTQLTSSRSSARALLLALDATSGDLRWAFTHDAGPRYERFDGVVIDGSDIYLAGRTDDQSMDVLVARVDTHGELVWSQTIGSSGWDAASGSPVVLSGLLYVAGRWNANSVSNGGYALLSAFSTVSGNEVWQQVDGDPGRTTGAFDLASDSFNLFLIGAASTTDGTHVRLWSYSSSGFLQWRRDWGGRGDEFGFGLAVDRFDGSLLATGQTTSFGAGGNDLFLLRYDRLGAPRDTLFWGGSGYDAGEKVVAALDAIYVAGETASYGQGGTDGVVLRIR